MMHRIYSQSQLVVVAAAGNNSEHGLPGVSATFREGQRIVRLDDVELSEIFQPHVDLEEST
jgi:hypothetical protein